MITFNNGKSFDTVCIIGNSIEFQNARRDSLDIIIKAEDITLDEAKALWNDTAATSALSITSTVNDNGTQRETTDCYVNYNIPVSLTLNQLNGEDVVHIKLAQMSTLEIAQAKQAQDISDANAALCELAELITGGGEVDG